MTEPEARVNSALPDIQREFLIRAIKMNAAHADIHLDFRFVDNCVQK
jgi:hypothetical protein